VCELKVGAWNNGITCGWDKWDQS